MKTNPSKKYPLMEGETLEYFSSVYHKQAFQIQVVRFWTHFQLICIPDEAEDPKCAPIVWVSKWVDYSDKYGFGYALSDESIGVVFNDLTKLLLLADQK